MATGSKLVIVESPTKAKKIGGYLGSGYTVMASVGHIRDLAQPSQVPAAEKAKYGKFGVDIEDGFKPYYIVDGNKKKTVADLKSALKKADTLYLATDEDREGEAIAWHLVQTLKPKVPVKRMVFHEITPEAIKASLNNTRDVDAAMVDAQETRRILDRLYGYELSPVLWRKVGPGLSAGRVQSVATRLIVERERERMAFVRAPYWDVTATLEAPDADGNNVAFDSRMVSLGGRRLAGSKDFGADGKLTAAGAKDQVVQLDEAQASAIAQALEFATFTVASMETKPYRRRPVPPFTTSTLQQTAGNRLGMSSRQTMRAAQGLYENGFITYMRTDSVTLSQEAIAAAREAVSRHFGEKYLSDAPKQYATKTAGAQEAHECIRPAGAHFRDPAEIATKVPADQLKLYTLIWQRTLACQMADATGSTATVRLSAPTESDGEAMFQASGTVIEFPGFMKATGEGRRSVADAKKSAEAAGVKIGDKAEKSAKASKKTDDNVSLPPMQPGSSIMPGKVNPVIPEVVNQICYRIIGNDLTVTFAAEAGQLQLNVMEPVMVHAIFSSIKMLQKGMDRLRILCVEGITANTQHCREMVLNSIGIVTALNPTLGYENSSRIAKRALKENRSVYDLVLEEGLLTKDELDQLLKPESMIKPHKFYKKK